MRVSTLALVTLVVGAAACQQAPAATAPVASTPTPTPTTSARFEFTVAPLADAEFVDTVGRSWTGSFDTVAAFGRIWGPDVVVAPAAGRVVSIVSGTSGVRVDLIGAGLTPFYLMGLASTSVTVGQVVSAGDDIGRRRHDSRGRGLGIDLGVMSLTPQPFLTPARYSNDVLYCDDPIRYFAEPLKAQLQARAGLAPMPLSDDVAGTLMGHWFDETLPFQDSAEATVQTSGKKLWFFTTTRRPGGSSGPRMLKITTLSGVGSGVPLPGSPDPASITPASGLVRFYLEPSSPSAWPEVLLVQMVSSDRLRVEGWYGKPGTEPNTFSSAARFFIR